MHPCHLPRVYTVTAADGVPWMVWLIGLPAGGRQTILACCYVPIEK